MKTEEFARIRELEDTHWWYAGRRYLLKHLINTIDLHDALILDAGSGTGFAGKELAGSGTVVSLDSSPDAFNNRIPDENHYLADICNTPFENTTFDLIIAMDLLEHIEDDIKAIREIYRICKDDGLFFLTVPAYMSMWSAHDESLEHKRRYSLDEIKTKIKSAGFITIKSSYFVSSVFPAAYIYRAFKRNSSPSSDLSPTIKPVNSILRSIMKSEAKIAWNKGIPFGMTAFILAYKKSKG